MEAFEAWLEDELIGTFTRDGGRIDFRYADTARRPISLSMPLSGVWAPDAPARFLEGLLPDDPAERLAMRKAYGAPLDDPLDLLAGCDASGALRVIGSGSRSCPQPVRRAGSELIADKVRQLSAKRGVGQSQSGQGRFALAGAQKKFALARVGRGWAWPDGEHPSTHIVKPSNPDYPDVELVEDTVMKLAASCGVATARPEVVKFGGERAYVVERFDRRVGPDGDVRRVHVEDFAQALGLSPRNKYGVTARQVIELLKGLPCQVETATAWIELLAFNTLVGNCDAHAKNYSLFLHGNGSMSLCPLYDSMCTRYWPSLCEELAMSINGKRRPQEITLDDWAAEAALDGLGQATVVETVANIALSIAANLDTALDDLPTDVGQHLGRAVVESGEAIYRQLGLLDNDGLLLREPRRNLIEFISFPDEIEIGTLSAKLFDAAPFGDRYARIDFRGDVRTVYGQQLADTYAVVPAGRFDDAGNVTLGIGEQVTLYDSRFDAPTDTLWWVQACDANRDALGVHRRLLLERDGVGRWRAKVG